MLTIYHVSSIVLGGDETGDKIAERFWVMDIAGDICT